MFERKSRRANLFPAHRPDQAVAVSGAAGVQRAGAGGAGQSIRENGLLQPISVRKASDGGYELVAGGAAAPCLPAGKDDHHPGHPVQLRR